MKQGRFSAPEMYVAWINANIGFNPRAQQHSNALSTYITEDLRTCSEAIASALDLMRLVTILNVDVRTRIAPRNVDLVFSDPQQPGPLRQVRLAVEHKSIMTAHGKARWNRYGDIIAYNNHLHNHNPHAIAASTVIINLCPNYRNPDPFATGIDRHYPNMEKIVASTVKIFADIPLRESENDPNDQPEAIAVIVVDYDGLRPAKLVTDPPAPQPSDAVHYRNFCLRLCDLYDRRFGED